MASYACMYCRGNIYSYFYQLIVCNMYKQSINQLSISNNYIYTKFIYSGYIIICIDQFSRISLAKPQNQVLV